MRPPVNCIALRLVILTLPAVWMSGAHAALGGDAASISLDAALLHGQLQPLAPLPGAAVLISTDNGIIIHEFLDTGGTVYAVSWSGPAVPDIRALLGGYFGQYASALKSLPHAGRQRAVHLMTADLVVDTAGHLRAYSGRAYLPAAVPAAVSLESLR